MLHTPCLQAMCTHFNTVSCSCICTKYNPVGQKAIVTDYVQCGGGGSLCSSPAYVSCSCTQQSVAAHIVCMSGMGQECSLRCCHVECAAYCSVEFALLAQDEQKRKWSHRDGPYVRPIASVQLQTRHWIMRDVNGEVTSEVRGEGVIGEFPILIPGRLSNTSGYSHCRICTVKSAGTP